MGLIVRGGLYWPSGIDRNYYLQQEDKWLQIAGLMIA